MTFTVRIYLIQRGCDVWRWLCARCLKELEAEGWSVRKSDDPPHAISCDGDACKAAREATAKAASYRATAA